MPTLSDYNSFDSFFSKNKGGALNVFKKRHNEFELLFNLTLEVSRTNFKSKQEATAVSLYSRALKYLYTSHILALYGHTEESRILLRNVIELMILGYLVYKKEEVYKLWLECFEKRKNNTSDKGRIDPKDIKDKKYEVAGIASKYKKDLDFDSDVKHLLRLRGEFSTFYSHENLFNIAIRMEQGDTAADVYIGTSYESKNDRMAKNIQLTIDILRNIEALMKKITNS